MENQLITAEVVIRKALIEEAAVALGIVKEYYEAMKVVARDTPDDFAQLYFSDGAGIWLAWLEERAVGCIALRAMSQFVASAEVKRLYVRSEHRGRRISTALHDALQDYATRFGYRWLYLDTVDDMKSAIRFYEGQGYERCARYNDNPQATIFMRKELRVSVRQTEKHRLLEGNSSY